MNKLCAFGDDSSAKSVHGGAFGIDLGTTNSAICTVISGGAVETIPVEEGGRKTMPSCVMWTGNGREFIVGLEAYNHRDQKDVVYSVKTLMQDPNATVTFEKEDGRTLTMTPAEVSAEILKALVQKTKGFYGEIKDVVITVPAYFTLKGVEATAKAAALAGLNVLGIIAEPTAATICFKLEKESGKVVLAYDLGGGTFDTSLIKIEEDAPSDDFASLYGITADDSKDKDATKRIRVLDTNGDSHLGGDDYDKQIFKRLAAKIKKEHGYFNEWVDIPVHEREEMILRIERFKKRGINNMYSLHYQFHVPAGVFEGQVDLQPEDFVEAFKPIFSRTLEKVKSVLERSEYQPDTIMLVGGSTKNPILKEMLAQSFPGLKINDAYNPDESVAQGAAIHAARLKFGDDSVQVFDILPIAIGIKDNGVVSPIIERGSSLPIVKTETFTTMKNNQECVIVELYQGDSCLVSDCAKIGTIKIDGIKPALAGVPKLIVKLSISADSLLTCHAIIDGVDRELQVSLTARKDDPEASQELSKEQKAINRWLAFAETVTDAEKKAKLIDMVKGYPVTTRAEIVEFISTIRGEA